MKSLLQDISFRVSRYFRPLEPWQCGGHENGQNCLLGPDKRGNCRAASECDPEKQEDAWKCTRKELAGGVCVLGPRARGECSQQQVPCVPLRSLRWRRARILSLSFAAMTGLVLSAMAFDYWKQVGSAGPLSKHHASFGSNDCGACHQASEQSQATWLSNLTAPYALSDSNNCKSCHVIGESPNQPHSLSEGTLASYSTKSSHDELVIGANDAKGAVSRPSMLLSMAKLLRGDETNSLACSSCHNEHSGANARITQVSDQQCAVCHSNSFDQLQDHPSFGDYPASRRTGIIFDHNSHIAKHFSDDKYLEQAPSGCLDCHELDSVGRRMQLRGFEPSCAACHNNEISGESRATAKGIPLLSVPAIDTQLLESRGVDIGDWPQSSDAELTPLLVKLVSSLDPELKEVLPALLELDLYDLGSASDQQLSQVYQLSWRIKQVFLNLQRAGAQGLTVGLLDPDIETAGDVLSLFASLSPDTADALVQQAFPNLETEVSDWIDNGVPRFTVTKTEGPQLTSDSSATSKVTTVEASASAADAPGADASDDDWFSQAMADESDDDVTADSDSLEDDGWFKDALTADDLGDDEFSDDDWDDDESDQQIETDDVSMPLDQANLQSTLIAEFATVLPVQQSIEDRAVSGGWYVEGYSLYYRPGIHADSLIVSWIEFLLSSSDKTSLPTQPLLNVFTDDQSPGACVKCHSIERSNESGKLQVNWLAAQTLPRVHDFNRFTHQSHFSAAQHSREIGEAGTEQIEQGCQACHSFNRESTSAESYSQLDPSVFSSDFGTLDKQACQQCHEADQQLQSCTQCHNYHIGEHGLVEMNNALRP